MTKQIAREALEAENQELRQQLDHASRTASALRDIVAQRSTATVGEFIDGVRFLVTNARGGEAKSKQALENLHEAIQMAAAITSIATPQDGPFYGPAQTEPQEEASPEVEQLVLDEPQ